MSVASSPAAGFTGRSRLKSASCVLGVYAVCIASALAISALVVWAAGGSWTAVFSSLLNGSLLRPGRWGRTIGEAIPLLLVALGMIVNLKAGLVNIGQEGQLYVGAAFAAYVGTFMGGPGVLVLIVLLLAGVLGGALWAGLCSVLRYWRGVPEVLSSLLLVFAAAQLVGYGLKNTRLLLDPTPDTGNRNFVSEQLSPSKRLPRVGFLGNEFPVSVFVALALAVLLALVLRWSIVGFRLQMLGSAPRAAHRAGVSERLYGGLSLVVSGAFCGLAGAFMLSGGDFGNYRLTPGFPVNIGWEGLLVALVARSHPILAIPVAFVFAALRTGSGFLAAAGVDRGITRVVQALLVLALLIPPAVFYLRGRRRVPAERTARA